MCVALLESRDDFTPSLLLLLLILLLLPPPLPPPPPPPPLIKGTNKIKKNFYHGK
jgi:hypothetical protein